MTRDEMQKEMGLPPDVRYLMEAGRWAPSADNMQPWRFQWSGDTLRLCFARERLGSGFFGPHHPATLLAMGAAAENMIAAAEGAGIPVDWTIPDLDSAEEVYLEGRIANTSQRAVRETDHPLFSRHTNRLNFRRQPVTSAALAAPAKMTEGRAGVGAITAAGEIRGLGRVLAAASRIRFRHQAMHDWFHQSLRFAEADAERGDGLDIRTLPLPPGGRTLLRSTADWRVMSFLNALGAYKLFAAIEARPFKMAPALVTISGGDMRRDVFDAGRLAERVWCDLNARGLAVQPSYVISDILHRYQAGSLSDDFAPAAHKLKTVVDGSVDSGKTLWLLFRVGWPKREPKKAKRLPLSVLADW